MTILQILSCFAIVAVSVVSADGTERDLTGYGLEEPDSSSCGTPLPGTFVDKMYDSKCFIRKVTCSADGNVESHKSCPDNQVYIADDDDTCYDVTSATVQTSCGVSVHCGASAMTVHVDDAAIWQQTAADLQFNPGTDDECKFEHNNGGYYEAALSLLTSGGDTRWDNCAATRSVVTINDQLAVKYAFKVIRDEDRETGGSDQRVEEQHGALVTREKCFMMDVQCYYKADGTASSSYKPTAAGALTKEDESNLEFAMYPIGCPGEDNEGQKLSSAPVVYVKNKVCYETEITSNFHPEIRISTTNCWATPSSDPEDSTIYQLSGLDANSDSTFDWDCHDGSYKEKFSFSAFRFQHRFSADGGDINDEKEYAQTMWVHCDVNACADSDTSSADCGLHTQRAGTVCANPNARRRRRAISEDSSMLSKLTKGKTISKMYVVQPQGPVTYDTPRYNMLSDTLSMVMFATGCVFAIVAVGLLVVMKRAKNQLKYKVLNNE